MMAFAASALFADFVLSPDARAAESEPISVRSGMNRPCREKIPKDVLARANDYLARTTNRDHARERYRFVPGSSAVLRADSCSGPVVGYQVTYAYAPLRVVGAMPDEVVVDVPFDSTGDIAGLVGFKAEDGTVVEPTITKDAAFDIARDHDPRFADLSGVWIQPTDEDEIVSDDDPCPKRNRNWQVTLCNEGREGERCSASASLKVDGTTGEVVAPWPEELAPPQRIFRALPRAGGRRQ